MRGFLFMKFGHWWRIIMWRIPDDDGDDDDEEASGFIPGQIQLTQTSQTRHTLSLLVAKSHHVTLSVQALRQRGLPLHLSISWSTEMLPACDWCFSFTHSRNPHVYFELASYTSALLLLCATFLRKRFKREIGHAAVLIQDRFDKLTVKRPYISTWVCDHWVPTAASLLRIWPNNSATESVHRPCYHLICYKVGHRHSNLYKRANMS